MNERYPKRHVLPFTSNAKQQSANCALAAFTLFSLSVCLLNFRDLDFTKKIGLICSNYPLTVTIVKCLLRFYRFWTNIGKKFCRKLQLLFQQQNIHIFFRILSNLGSDFILRKWLLSFVASLLRVHYSRPLSIIQILRVTLFLNWFYTKQWYGYLVKVRLNSLIAEIALL